VVHSSCRGRRSLQPHPFEDGLKTGRPFQSTRRSLVSLLQAVFGQLRLSFGGHARTVAGALRYLSPLWLATTLSFSGLLNFTVSPMSFLQAFGNACWGCPVSPKLEDRKRMVRGRFAWVLRDREPG
jgi:hypothetical protein